MVYENNSNPFAAGFFFANGPGVNLKLREKIALAQMMQKRAYPKTFGEGLSAIGESLGDIGTARRLEEQDRISQQAAMGLGAPPASTPTAEAAPGAMPPPAAANVAPTSLAGRTDPTSQAPVPSTVQEGAPSKGMTVRPGINMPPPMQAAAPAVPTPPDQRQSYETGAPVRMSTPAQIADFRAQNPLPPNIPPPPGQQPQPPGWTTDKQFNALDAAATPPAPPRPSVADYGQKLALAATPPPGAPPVVASDAQSLSPEADAQRRAIGATLLKQQMGGQQAALPPAAPPVTPPAPPPNQDIAAAPPAAPPIRSMPPPPQAAPEQPGAVAGYVPPPLADPTKATVIPPSKRERELQVILNANQGNPYAAGSPAALELQDLQNERAKQQALEDKKTEAEIARTTKREELRQQGLMDQDKRLWESRRSGIEVGDLPRKLQQEGEKRVQELQRGQQELIAPAGAAPQPNLLGTPQSPQRSGIPTTPPVPPGITPQKWAELHAPEHQKNLAVVESATPDVAESLSLLNKIREHPAREMGVGAFNKLYANTPQGAGFKALMDQLGGKNFLIGYQKLKGSGAISEIEGTKTEQAQARLTTAQDKTDFDNALNDLEGNLRSGLERAQRKINQPVTAYQNTPNDPVAPDIGQIGTRGGKMVEYIGGDPSKDSSYRTPRR